MKIFIILSSILLKGVVSIIKVTFRKVEIIIIVHRS